MTYRMPLQAPACHPLTPVQRYRVYRAVPWVALSISLLSLGLTAWPDRAPQASQMALGQAGSHSQASMQPASPANPDAAELPGSNFTVQAGRFANLENAVARMQALRAQGAEAEIVVQVEGASSSFVVLIGHFADATVAQNTKLALLARNGGDLFITKRL